MVPLFRTCLLLLLSTLIAAQFAAADEGDESLAAAILFLNGTTYEDVNGDRFRNEGEPGLAGWSLRLVQDHVEIANTTADEFGSYAFSNLSPGNYEVREYPTSGWNMTAPGSGYYSVTLTDKPARHLDFGNIRSDQLTNITAAPFHRAYPIMQPTPDEASRWMKEYQASPGVYLSPQISAQLSQAAGLHYSLLDHLQYVPSERDQGYCGNCWAWAGTGVMEIANSFQNNIEDRLSIQYLNSNFRGGCGLGWSCCGGWLSDVANLYSSTDMAVPWSNANAHWQDGNRFCELQSTSVPASIISTSPNYPIISIIPESIPTRGTGKETAIANIKNVLHQGRAIWFAFFLPTSSDWNNFYSFWSSQSEDSVWRPDFACAKQFNYYEGGGHAVLCVGYDDTDPNNRYWIMLNSWGAPSRRPNGLFRVNMDMNYDCSYGGLGYAFSWMTLGITYPSGPNNPPEIPSVPIGPSEGGAFEPISFSTSAEDPDGDRVRYTFDWGDETSSQTDLVGSGNSASANHIWSEAGNFEVKARTTDSKGISSEWSEATTITIIMQNRPPVAPALPSGPTKAYAGASSDYFASTIDPEGDSVRYTFDWGDGATSETDFADSGVSVRASHIWNAPGTYRVKVRATDSSGAYSDWSSPLTVNVNLNNPPYKPTLPRGPTSGFTGTSYSYSAAASDPNRDKVKYTFDWGDATTSETGFVISGLRASRTHAWDSPGTYQIRTMATDIKGGISEWSKPLTVVVSTNLPPQTVSAPIGPATGRTRFSYSYSASASDPERDRLKYIFDWGDGTTSKTRQVPSGSSISMSHRWLRTGTYYVKFLATDHKGASSDWSEALEVVISNTVNSAPERPSPPQGPSRGTRGRSYYYSTSATDQEGDSVKYVFDWGDRTETESRLVKAGTTVRARHLWKEPGKYQIKANARDLLGASSEWSSTRTMEIS